MGIITLSTLLIAGAGFYLFSRNFGGFGMGIKRLQTDLKKLTAVMDTVNVDVIPLNSKELESLSATQAGKSGKSRSTRKGAFVTIFEEPLIKYAAKDYDAKRENMVIIAEAGGHQYSYLALKGKVQMVVDDQVLGSYDPNTGTLSGSRTKKTIAQLDRSRPEQNIITVKGKDVASMNKKISTDSKGLSKRVFEYVVDGLSPEELVAAVAITIFELVRQTGK